MGRGVSLLKEEEIALVRESSLLVGRTLAEVARYIGPGVTTRQLDRLAEDHIRGHGGEPVFKGFKGFPNALCVSVNDHVVHGIPNDEPLREGSIVSVDCGVRKNGFIGDSAYTFAVGEVSAEIRMLLRVTMECLDLGVAQAVDGNRTGDIGFVVQEHAEAHRYGVVRELTGHGVGRELHEPPEIPNYGRRGHGPRLRQGMVIAIEPMINLGTREVVQYDDGWTIATRDGRPSAHFEHTLAIRPGKPEVLTTFSYIEEVLKSKGELLMNE